MKIRFILLVLGLLILRTVAQARLGETEAELIKRFGKPSGHSKHVIVAQGKILEMGPVLYFRQDDWSITCDMVDGRCMRIGYNKPGDWTEDQIQLVLATNSQGAIWTEVTEPFIKALQRKWKRSDASTATWMKSGGIGLVWDAYNKAKAKLEEQTRVKAADRPKI